MRHNPGGVFSGSQQVVPYTAYTRYDHRAYESQRQYSAYKRETRPPKPKPRKRKIVSQALWCDAGEHAFSSNDPNRHRFAETKMERDSEYGGNREVTTEVDVCGPCWHTNNPFRKDTEPTSLPGDAKNEDYLRGYKEGILKGEVIS